MGQNNLQYTLSSVGDDGQGNITFHFGEGGQQVNSYSWVLGAANIQNGSRFFVENVFQELDAPGEFFHDVAERALYVVPPVGVTPPSLDGQWPVEIVAALAQRVLDVRGAGDAGVLRRQSKGGISNLHFQGLEVAMSAPTFLELYEVPARGDSDWTIHRGGAVFFEAVSNVTFSDGHVHGVGSNAVFVSHAAREVSICGNRLGPDVGESGVAVMGSLVRSTGLGGLNFPLRVNISGNRISEIGSFGKQVSGIFVSIAGFVTMSDNVIHGSPSSGIKINDGFVGGHVTQYNHIYDVTRETTDMGAINLHNRDRFYVPGDSPVWNKVVDDGYWESQFPMPFQRGPAEVDTVHPVIVRGNLFETTVLTGAVGQPGDWYGQQGTIFCVDIDDGPTRYLLTENVCIANGTVGIKIGHVVDELNITNNIVVSFSGVPGTPAEPFYVGQQTLNNSNVFTRNVMVWSDAVNAKRAWKISNLCPWNAERRARQPPPALVDWNMYFANGSSKGVAICPNYTVWTKVAGLDVHSLFGTDPLLLGAEPGQDDFPFHIRVADASPAVTKFGFQNFEYGPRNLDSGSSQVSII